MTDIPGFVQHFNSKNYENTGITISSPLMTFLFDQQQISDVHNTWCCNDYKGLNLFLFHWAISFVS